MKRSGTHNQRWQLILDEVRELAIRTGTGRSKLLRRLDALEQAMAAEIDVLDDARRRRIVGPRARVRAAIYSVEDSPRGPALTERRDSDARPFKCPKPVYDAVAMVVGDSAEPRSFQEIKQLAEHHLGESLPDYAVRTPLRFWSVLGLIHHEQARFFWVGTRSRLVTEARRSWRKVDSEPLRLDPQPEDPVRKQTKKSPNP